MILTESASLILSAVQQLVKLGNRIDTLIATRTAVQADLVLNMPRLRLDNLALQTDMVRHALDDTRNQQPDPFGADRAAFEALLGAPGGPDATFDPLFKKYFPDQFTTLISPDGAYLTSLQAAFPTLDWTQPGTRIAALALAAGSDPKQISYNARIAFAVADTLLEFGSQNTALFVGDKKLQGIVQSVLEHFAQPDWAGFTTWNPLLQTALKTTLNAAFDVAEKLPDDNPWLQGTLDALAQARADAANPDDYLLGLLQGEGVPLLFSKGLLIAGEKLGSASTSSYKQVVADVLKEAAPILKDATNPNLAQFFKDHWADLLRAGLTSIDKHGDTLINTTTPLLSSVLKGMVKQLAATPGAQFLSGDTVYQLTDAAISAVVANSGQLTTLTSQPWADFLTAVAKSAQQLTAKNLFTTEAADAILRDAIGVVGKYPSLIVSGKGLPATLIGSIFTAVAALPNLSARTVGETALRTALTTVAADPNLATTAFGPVVTAVATQLAADVGTGKITADQAAGLASVAIAAVARNPQIYAGAKNDIAGAVVTAVQKVFPAGAQWTARMLVQAADQALLAVGRNGAAKVKTSTAAQLTDFVTTILDAGLKTAINELGNSTDLDGIPPVLGGLIGQVLQGKLTAVDPTDPAFIAAFQALAAKLAA